MSTHHTSHRLMIRQIDTLLLLNFLILFVSIKCKWIVSLENAEALLVFAIFFFFFCSIESFLFVWRLMISCVLSIYIYTYISYFENAKSLPCVRHFSFYSHFYFLFCPFVWKIVISMFYWYISLCSCGVIVRNWTW